MADSQVARYALTLTVIETLDSGVDNESGSTTLTHGWDTSGTLRSDTTVPATKSWSDTRSLTAGTDSLDLTSLSRGNLAAVDCTGLRVQLFKITAASANTASIVLAQGDTNPYFVMGATGGTITIPAGSTALFHYPDKLADVSSSAKALKVTSSDADASYQVELVAG